MKKILILLALACSFGPLLAQTDTLIEGSFSGSIVRSFSMNYLISLPDGYIAEGSQSWPLLVFLHGSGERGDNLTKVKVHGPPMLVAAGEKLPFIVLSPQCREGSDWEAEELYSLIRQIAKQYKVDEQRIYVTGLSMGGRGTWDLAMAHPEFIAAIAPVCGPVDRNFPERAETLKDMPVWVFHGAMDDVVPITGAAIMVKRLHDVGNSAKFTIYPDANHDSWTETYNNRELYNWFLQQKME